MVLLCALALQVGRVLWQGRRGRTGAEQRRRWPARLPWSVIAPATLVILLALIPQYPTQPAGSLRIGAVQGNGPAAYADARNPGDVFNAQLSASRPLADEDVDLVLWPEGGVDCDPLADPGAALRLNAAARAYGAPILVNSAVETSDGIVNQSLLWTAEGPTASHGKRHPVPFGEYVPDRWLYEKLAPGVVGMLQREYVPGDDAPRIETGGVAAGLAICFDVAFDDVIAESVLGGSQVHLFQTNNADFRGTDEHLQQLAFARMRAIETGRSVVNLSTTGSSQVFDPAGNTLAEVPPGRPGVLVAEVDLRDGRTPGVVLGASIRRVIFWGTLASLALVGVLNSRRRPPRVGQQLGQGLLR